MLTDAISTSSLRAAIGRECRLAFGEWRQRAPREWAETVRRRPTKHGATVPFSFAYAPYQLGMFLSIFDPEVQETIFQIFSRGGKSEVMLTALGYFIEEEPSYIFAMWPTLRQAEKWSKSVLMRELIEPTPSLSALISDGSGKRDASNTILYKLFFGGLIDIVGANSPGDIRRAKGNVLMADEIDAIQEIESDEGDQLKQFKGRGEEYPDTREMYASYPSVRGKSRIEAKLLESDLNEWFVTCPLCDGEPFIMHRTGIDPFNDGLKRSKLLYDADKPELARLECPNCRGHLDDSQRYAMMMGGDPANPRFDLWRPTRPFRGKRGFHANALLFPHPISPKKYPGGLLHRLAQDEIDIERSDNPERSRRVFINRVDAETYEAPCDAKPDHTKLFLRREDYNPTEMLPAGVLWIAFTCDVQGAALNPAGPRGTRRALGSRDHRVRTAPAGVGAWVFRHQRFAARAAA